MEMRWDVALQGPPSEAAAVNLQHWWKRQSIIAYPVIVLLSYRLQESIPKKIGLLPLVHGLKHFSGDSFQGHDLVLELVQERVPLAARKSFFSPGNIHLGRSKAVCSSSWGQDSMSLCTATKLATWFHDTKSGGDKNCGLTVGLLK